MSESKWTRPGALHDSIYKLGLSLRERDVFCYCIAHCTKRYALSIEIMALSLSAHADTIRSALRTLCQRKLIEHFPASRGTAHSYQVSLLSRPGWGIPLAKGTGIPLAKGTYLPSGEGMTSPSGRALTINLEGKYLRSGDAALLSLGIEHVRKWRFSHTPLGVRGHVTRKQHMGILEMMRGLHSEGLDHIDSLTSALALIGEYLSLNKDPLGEGKDLREKTLTRFLATWADQWHRAKSYGSIKKADIVPFTNEKA